MGIKVFRFGVAIFALLSIWDIVTGVIGIASAMSDFPVTDNLLQTLIDLIFKKPAATFLGVLFAFVVVILDYYFLEKWKGRINYTSVGKKWIWVGLFFWGIAKWFDFSTTVVGTAKVLSLKLPPKVELGEVLSIVTSNSWSQMALLLALSLMITSSHIGILVCLYEIESLEEEEKKKNQNKLNTK